jgi:glycosyltransferase involved in cell wall biosynthesis
LTPASAGLLCKPKPGRPGMQKACCAMALTGNLAYRCLIENHLTCSLHLYMDAGWRPHCYTCMTELPYESFRGPLIYRTPRRPGAFRKTVVVVLHALHMCGTARHCLELARELRRKGFSVTILAVGGGGHWAHRFLGAADTLIVAAPSDTWTALFDYINEPDVVFITAHHDPAISWTMTNAPSDVPVFAHFHVEPTASTATASLLSVAVRRCKRILFPSDRTLEQYRALIPAEHHSVLGVLENNLPHDLFPRPAIIETVAALLPPRSKPADSARHLAVISRLDSDKFSIPLFVATLQAVTRIIPQLTVSVAGTGEMQDEVRKAVAEADLCRLLNFLGFVDDISRLYRAADAVFVPSRTEAMPYTALESASARTPCIMPRLGYFADPRTTLPYVLLFDRDDYQSAASLIAGALMQRRSHSPHVSARRSCRAWSRAVSAAYYLEAS